MSRLSINQIAKIIVDLKSAGKSITAKDIAILLIINKRTKDLGKLIRAVDVIDFENNGNLRVNVSSVFELEQSVQQKIKEFMSTEFKSSIDKVEIDFSLDKSLLSGVVIDALGSRFDSSAKQNLKELRQEIFA